MRAKMNWWRLALVFCVALLSCGVAKGQTSWSSLTNPAANLSLSHGSFTTTFTYGASTGSGTNLFNLTDGISNTGTGYLFNLNTASGSSLNPLRVASKGLNALLIDPTG
jgi:hypothetical protein